MTSEVTTQQLLEIEKILALHGKMFSRELVLLCDIALKTSDYELLIKKLVSESNGSISEWKDFSVTMIIALLLVLQQSSAVRKCGNDESFHEFRMDDDDD